MRVHPRHKGCMPMLPEAMPTGGTTHLAVGTSGWQAVLTGAVRMGVGIGQGGNDVLGDMEKPHGGPWGQSNGCGGTRGMLLASRIASTPRPPVSSITYVSGWGL